MVRRPAWAICAIAMAGALAAQTPPPVTKRIAERLAVLQKEADDLARREKTLLGELRKLEIERQIKVEELAALDQQLKDNQQQLTGAIARAAALREAADRQRPDVEARLVRLYKMGRAGYWRLLLDVDDVQAMGRAYRTAAALTRLDRDRVQRHEQTLRELEHERTALEARAKEYAGLQNDALAARAALDRAVRSRAALVASINERKDLAVQLARELDAAQLRIQAAVAQAGGLPIPVLVPLRPFRGELPWPADGIVIGRFGRQRAGRMAGIDITRNGIEISLPEGRPVSAVHEGIVTFAGPFTAYGTMVIVDHGEGSHSIYGHLASAAVTKGSRVEVGTKVGTSGRNPSGNPALYFELRVDGRPVDPVQWLRKQS